MTYAVDLDFIRAWADVDGWRELDYQPNIGALLLQRGKYRANVYLTKGTLVIWRGAKTQRVYKRQTQEQIAGMLEQPSQFT